MLRFGFRSGAGVRREDRVCVGLRVEDLQVVRLFAQPDEKDGQTEFALGGACGVLLILLLLQGVILRRKIHRLEEDKL